MREQLRLLNFFSTVYLLSFRTHLLGGYLNLLLGRLSAPIVWVVNLCLSFEFVLRTSLASFIPFG